MSIEYFKVHFPASPELKDMLKGIRQTEQSLISVLASGLVNDAALGLKKLMERFNKTGLALKPDRKFFSDMAKEQGNIVSLHYSAILFGLTLRSIERMLIDRAFDGEFFITGYNRAIAGTTLTPATFDGDTYQPIDSFVMHLAHVIAAEDKTLGKFFTSSGGFATIPAPLKKFLEDTEALDDIKQTLLPIYLERARFLV